MNDFLSLGAILQPIPEHPKRDFIFCLSTAFGDAYLFQVKNTEKNCWLLFVIIIIIIIVIRRCLPLPGEDDYLDMMIVNHYDHDDDYYLFQVKNMKMLMILIYASIVSYHYCYLAIPTFSRWKYWR